MQLTAEQRDAMAIVEWVLGVTVKPHLPAVGDDSSRFDILENGQRVGTLIVAGANLRGCHPSSLSPARGSGPRPG